MKNSNSIENENVKSSNTFKYIILIIIFLLVGVAIGCLIALKYVEKNKKENEIEEYPTNGWKDITSNKNYTDLINSLHKIVDGNVMFYDSRGISIKTMDNNSKLIYIYNYVVNNNMYSTETINSVSTEACENNFLVDVNENPDLPSVICTVNIIKKSDLNDVAIKLFNDRSLNTNNNFNPTSNKSCVSSNDTYICGNIVNNSVITGRLEPKFTIEKVILTTDGNIEVYEKGYLVDNRSNVKNDNSKYDNYYLHSSDSTEYYYELKNADNLTFKHIFSTYDEENYVYVETINVNNK